jgi:hypothetical protein
MVSVFTSCYMLYRVVTLALGVGFFGSVFLRNSYGWLKHNMERYVYMEDLIPILLTI